MKPEKAFNADKKILDDIRAKKGQALKKYELAILYGVSKRTISRYLNDLYFDQLSKLGYRKNCIYLKPEIVQIFIHDWKPSREKE